MSSCDYIDWTEVLFGELPQDFESARIRVKVRVRFAFDQVLPNSKCCHPCFAEQRAAYLAEQERIEDEKRRTHLNWLKAPEGGELPDVPINGGNAALLELFHTYGLGYKWGGHAEFTIDDSFLIGASGGNRATRRER